MPNRPATVGKGRTVTWDSDARPAEGMVRSWLHVADGEDFSLEPKGERAYSAHARGLEFEVSWTWDGRVYLDGAYMDSWTWEYRYDMKKDCGECRKALDSLRASAGGQDAPVGVPAPKRKEKKP